MFPTDPGLAAKPYKKVNQMTTPDEEITGYGGQPRNGPATPVSSTKPAASQDFEQVAQDAKLKAREAAEQVKTQGKEQLDSYRDTAADEIEKVAQGVKAAAAELEGQDQSGLSHYVADMAQSMVQLADNLRGKSVDQLVGEVNRLARDNPALFITGSIALGFGLTRFARASSRHTNDDYHNAGGSTRFGERSGRDGDHLPSQREINEHIGSGEPGGTVGSISNAGGSSATSSTRTAGSPSSGAGLGEADTAAGLGMHSGTGTTPGNGTGAGLASNAGRDGKGKDGGLYP